jgi:hypothetical protein
MSRLGLRCACGDHSSRSQLALRLQQPTRGLLFALANVPGRKQIACGKHAPTDWSCVRLRERKLDEPGRLSPPIWPCTTRGFPCLRCRHRSGGLLPHLFTLAKRNEHPRIGRSLVRGGTGGSPSLQRRHAGLPARCHRAALCRRYVFCGTFRELFGNGSKDPPLQAPLALPGALPFTLRPLLSSRRVHPRPTSRAKSSSPALASLRRRCPDFPPARPACADRASDHPAHPPTLL